MASLTIINTVFNDTKKLLKKTDLSIRLID